MVHEEKDLLSKWCVMVRAYGEYDYFYELRSVKTLIDYEMECLSQGRPSGWSCVAVVDTYKDACDVLTILREKYKQEIPNDNVW